MKRLILCADDFGLNSAVSEGILSLVKKRRLSAISCMTNCAGFSENALQLKPYLSKVKVGLHFNLTEGQPLTPLPFLAKNKHFPTLPYFLIKTLLNRIPSQEIIQELEAQLIQFEKILEKKPDFIDGHQHIHQFPNISLPLLEVYQRHLAGNVSLRVAADNSHHDLFKGRSRLKRAFLYFSGGKNFRKLLEKKHIPHVPHFSGFYDFSKKTNYRGFFRQCLKNLKDETLIMCHPGLKNESSMDSIAQSRYQEYLYFSSDDFLRDCEEFDVVYEYIV